MFTGLLDLALVTFAILLFAEYAKIRSAAAQGFSLIAASGILFLLAASFAELSILQLFATAAGYGRLLFEGLGWLLLLAGTLKAAYALLPLKK